MFFCPLRTKFITLTLEPFRGMILLTLQSHTIRNMSALTDRFQHLRMFFCLVYSHGGHIKTHENFKLGEQ